ncbi:hypothetical protein V5N11_002136 [Cardamine amara subsp. amara]|uniref:GRF-type domain-containing protein n=1 Tax=Cardamine amara subsp. amara TaxID=228776 RepID=A0ABD1BVR2_CARAN
MSNYSTASSHLTARSSSRGVPTVCWCGGEITTFTSKTKDNPYRRFYRCVMGVKEKTEDHLFQWVDEALLEEIIMVELKHNRLIEEVKDLKKSVMDNMEFQNVMQIKMKEEIKASIEKELICAKEKMQNLGREMVKSTMTKVGVVVVVVGTVAWLCGKLI